MTAPAEVIAPHRAMPYTAFALGLAGLVMFVTGLFVAQGLLHDSLVVLGSLVGLASFVLAIVALVASRRPRWPSVATLLLPLLAPLAAVLWFLGWVASNVVRDVF